MMRHLVHPVLPLLLLLASCAATPSRSAPAAPSPAEATLAAFADDLVERAELRADVRSIRLQVTSFDVREARPSRPGELEALARSLGHDLVLALSRNFHVIDSDVTATALPGATHALAGDLLRLDREVRVSLRLVEVPTGVIVATAEGSLLVQDLIDRGALAWEPHPEAADLAVADVAPRQEPKQEPEPEPERAPEPAPELEPKTPAEPTLEAVVAAEVAPASAPLGELENLDELPPVRGPASIRRGRFLRE